jgi:hypothetical protein
MYATDPFARSQSDMVVAISKMIAKAMELSGEEYPQ